MPDRIHDLPRHLIHLLMGNGRAAHRRVTAHDVGAILCHPLTRLQALRCHLGSARGSRWQVASRVCGFITIAMMFTLAACDTRTAGALTINSTAASSLPHLAKGSNRLVLSWVETQDASTRLRFATLQGASANWSEPADVASGPDWLVNWADFPSVQPISDTVWLAHWLVRQPVKGFAYDVVVAQSSDGGQTWSNGSVPHTDRSAVEHGFVSLFDLTAQAAGSVPAALWLDGRAYASATPSGHNSGHDTTGTTALMAAPLRDNEKGVGGEPDRKSEVAEIIIDPRVCDCCQTDMATTTSGAVAVYRDRSIDEIRDIKAVRLENGQWTTPVAIADDGWQIAGCPVNGPAVAAFGDRVFVAWFAKIGGVRAAVQLVTSVDAGRTFGKPVVIDDTTPIGRVDVVALPDGGVVSWLQTADAENANLMVARAVVSDTSDQTTLKVAARNRIAETSVARPAGFPQMERLNKDLILAWTDVSGVTSTIRTQRVPINSLVNLE